MTFDEGVLAGMWDEEGRLKIRRPAPDVLLTVKEYAALFRRHQQTVYKAIYRGTLKHPLERSIAKGQILIRVPRALVNKLRAA